MIFSLSVSIYGIELFRNNLVPYDELKLFFPDQAIVTKEFYEILQLCLSQLPPKWAAVFSLRTIDEEPTKDVCKEVGITASNLWVILHRARLQLRLCMEKNWLEI